MIPIRRGRPPGILHEKDYCKFCQFFSYEKHWCSKLNHWVNTFNWCDSYEAKL